MLRFFVYSLALSLSILKADKVHIVSNMYTEEILNERCFTKIKENFDIGLSDLIHNNPIPSNFDSIKRYLVFNIDYPIKELADCPPEKKVLILMEPVKLSKEQAQGFSRIYTWDDDIIDNITYFKYCFPDLLPMRSEIVPFEEKNLCTMIVRNWNASHRLPIVDFFSKKPKGEFKFYGAPIPNLTYSKCYGGRIPGINCGEEKIDVLKTYKFCICTENSTHLNGYISEKIFPIFAAGSLPIYWGAPNIEDYIPKDCYIDYRDFNNLDELYDFMKNMSETTYNQYLENIRNYLDSDQAKVFSQESFSEILYEAIVQ